MNRYYISIPHDLTENKFNTISIYDYLLKHNKNDPFKKWEDDVFQKMKKTIVGDEESHYL